MNGPKNVGGRPRGSAPPGRRARAGLRVMACLALAWVVAGSARLPAFARGWERVATQPGPAPAVLSLAIEDLDGDGRDEVVLAGRDYERQQDRLYVMGWSSSGGGALRTLATGPPLVEPMSHVVLAAGPFTRTDGPEVLVATNSRLVVWRWDGSRLEAAWEGQYSSWVQQAAAVHLPGEPAAVALAFVRTQPRWHLLLQVWHWNGRTMEPVAGPFPIGSVRAMTSGDMTGNGQSELLLEVGEGDSPGEVQVWQWQGGAFVMAGSARLRDAPVFGLGAGRLREVSETQDVVLTADDRGRVAVYRWDENKGFTRVGSVLTLSWSLVSAGLGDLDGDGRTEAVVAEYPNLLHVLRWQP